MSQTRYEGLIIEIISRIGENPDRPGLKDTPARVVKSHQEIYSGYQFDNNDIRHMLTMFDSDGYDEMVWLKNIEFYSTCEHHMLPFFGKAHIAYIPNKNIVGISKLARLLEIYSRRLQIQERIGRQVIDALDKYVKPKGSACILEAQHFCMTSRGINKQNSVMVTSALSGVFRTRAAAREELMRLIK
jgi:GTP cyclohydrolase I